MSTQWPFLIFYQYERDTKVKAGTLLVGDIHFGLMLLLPLTLIHACLNIQHKNKKSLSSYSQKEIQFTINFYTQRHIHMFNVISRLSTQSRINMLPTKSKLANKEGSLVS
jgi:hypothetical protein